MIEKYIAFGYSLREIAALIGCQPSTVSREVQKYRIFISPKSAVCANYSECRKKSHCNERCADFVPVHCSKLYKAPFVCNRCSNQDFCKKEHAYYHAQKAEARSYAVASLNIRYLLREANLVFFVLMCSTVTEWLPGRSLILRKIMNLFVRYSQKESPLITLHRKM